jgi:hypothetical protein
MSTPSQITEEIIKRPPAQREDAGKYYQDQKELWPLEYSHIYQSGEGRATIYTLEKGSLYPDVSFEINIADYPQFNRLPEKVTIWVEGEIEKVGSNGLSIQLKNVKIRFTEKEARLASQPNYQNFINSQVHLGTGDNIGGNKATISPEERGFWGSPLGKILIGTIVTVIGIIITYLLSIAGNS